MLNRSTIHYFYRDLHTFRALGQKAEISKRAAEHENLAALCQSLLNKAILVLNYQETKYKVQYCRKHFTSLIVMFQGLRRIHKTVTIMHLEIWHYTVHSYTPSLQTVLNGSEVPKEKRFALTSSLV